MDDIVRNKFYNLITIIWASTPIAVVMYFFLGKNIKIQIVWKTLQEGYHEIISHYEKILRRKQLNN